MLYITIRKVYDFCVLSTTNEVLKSLWLDVH